MEYHIDGICASLELLKSSMKFSAKAKGRKKKKRKKNNNKTKHRRGRKKSVSTNLPEQEREIAANTKEKQL